MKLKTSEDEGSALSRRGFLRSTAAGAAGLMFAGPVAWAAEPATVRPLARTKGSGGWKVLFDGKDLEKWDYRPQAWQIQKDGSVYSPGRGGDMYSKEKFQDFTLVLDFKMSKGCNSGVFVRMASRKDWLHSSMEIQVLDSFGKAKVGKHDCGAVYDALAPSGNAARKAGEWNRFRITCFKNHVFVALNRMQIIEMDLNKWTEAHKNPDGGRNKFRDPLKKLTHAGFFALQTHGKPIWYRNIRFKPLKALGKCPVCGRPGPEGWYCCAKCNAVCTTYGQFKCPKTGKTHKAGTYCAKHNRFRFPPDAPKCARCGRARGMLSPKGGYAICTGVAWCKKCKKPYPYKGGGCPACKKK